ncbi:hypothetical protein TNIN_352543 [Trichonephila inaurata madagascariensis]|uniref:Uncharacterized protein n=1 Tax=Trichonephila inaurata madagascariensis TaxID=2747483 RepID=A0A8X6XCK2_9ARAC|nr:hypothetical protein TNIN_352543 [Trichonephila inaurata madagascariensis]
METDIDDSKARWRAVLKEVFYPEPKAVKVNNCVDDDKTETKNNFCRNEIATDEPANNEDQIETDEPAKKDHNECENIKRNECDNPGCRLLNLLKEAILDESKKSAHTNSVDDDSVIPYEHSQSSIDWENDDLDNAENFDLLGESASGSSSKKPEKIVFKHIWDDFPELKKEMEEMKRQDEAREQRLRLTLKRKYKKRRLTAEEKEILDTLKAARTFKRVEKPHYNIFDGAGVDCFHDRRRNESEYYDKKYFENFPRIGDVAQRQADRYLERLWEVEKYSEEDLPSNRDDRYMEKLWGIEEDW